MLNPRLLSPQRFLPKGCPQVKDSIPSGNYKVDIDNQSSNNYLYDRIGNLRKDVAENIDSIRWTVYGKIRRVKKPESSVDPGFSVDYGYDASGQRTWKKTYDGTTTNQTFYVRDAQGNVLAVYTRQNNNTLRWAEQHLYGSSRLGMWTVDTTIPSSPPVVTGSPIQDSILLGSRNYELTNHLGNVLAVISDKKIGNDSSGVVNYYIAEVLSQNDYYPFGMLMPGRGYSAGTGYRYGFNGKEQDPEISGQANQYDYGFRIYNPRLGKFLSVDPLYKEYPELTPYQFASNRPIDGIDLDGLEHLKSNNAKVNVYVDFDPVIKQITEVEAYINYQNLTGWLKQKLHKQYNLSGNYYDPNVVLALEVASVEFEFPQTPTITKTVTSQEALEEGDKKEPGFQYTKTIVNKVSTKHNNVTTRNNGTAGIQVNNIQFESKNQRTVARVEAVVKVIEWGATLFADYVTVPAEVSKINNQASFVTGTIAKYLSSAIEEKMIPDPYLNTKSLTAIGNYLLSGEIPKLTRPSGVVETDYNLLGIAKAIWAKIDTDTKAAAAKNQMERAVKERQAPNKTDNTSNKINTLPRSY